MINLESRARQVLLGASWILLALGIGFAGAGVLLGRVALAQVGVLMALTAASSFLLGGVFRRLVRRQPPALEYAWPRRLMRAAVFVAAGVGFLIATILAANTGQVLLAEAALFVAAFLILVPAAVVGYAPIRQGDDYAATQLGFNDFASYYRERVSAQWDTQRIADELGWSASRVKRAAMRTAADRAVRKFLYGP